MSGQNEREVVYRERNSTADRALDILLLFADDRLVLSASEVASSLNVARSTAYRYLQSLVASEFIEEQGGRGGFRLGPRVLELARLARKGIGLSEVARPVMRALADEIGETVLLTRRSGGRVVCLEREEADHPIRLSYERGHILPANAGASALVVLAWAPQEDIDDVAASGLARHTAATVVTPEVLRERLSQIRSQGFAVTRGELDPDVLGVAAPIRDEAGQVVAGLSVAALSSRVPERRVPQVVGRVTESAGVIADRLQLLGN